MVVDAVLPAPATALVWGAGVKDGPMKAAWALPAPKSPATSARTSTRETDCITASRVGGFRDGEPGCAALIPRDVGTGRSARLVRAVRRSPQSLAGSTIPHRLLHEEHLLVLRERPEVVG